MVTLQPYITRGLGDPMSSSGTQTYTKVEHSHQNRTKPPANPNTSKNVLSFKQRETILKSLHWIDKAKTILKGDEESS